LQRIGLDWIDRPPGHPFANINSRNSENQTARERNKRLGWRIERYKAAQMPLPEEPVVQEVSASVEGGHAQTCDAAGSNRENDKTRFVAPHERART
jgi:hypothetical protein